MTGLAEAAAELLAEARTAYRDSHTASTILGEQERRLRQPLRVAVAGRQGVGKSTLVNALVGEPVAPLACGDGQCPPAWYTDGQQPQATVRTPDGGAYPLAVSRHGGGAPVDLGSWEANRIDHVEVAWPARTLRDVILLDCGPLDGESGPEAPARRVAADADAVLHLARQPDGPDLRALWAWQSGRFAAAAPLPVVLVLAHADARGGGRIDALTASRQLARRYRDDDRLRPLCAHVLAASAQLADAGRRLSGAEYESLLALASLPKQELEPVLLSADRVAGARLTVDLPQAARQELLARFGIAGIRLATTLIRQRVDGRAGLAGELTERSGLTELRECLGTDLVAHRPTLKARTVLAALDDLLRAEPRPGVQGLANRVERTLAGAHEFRELRVLTGLRTGAVTLPGSWRAEAERLVGAYGESLPERLDVPPDTPGGALRAEVAGALARWRDRAANPVVGSRQRTVAAVLARTCERLAGVGSRRG